MKSVLHQFRSGTRDRSYGFSLLEMLISIGILSVLILALYSLFDQTQKALRANINQVDVSEGGRSVMDLVARDVARARSVGINTNLIIDPKRAVIEQFIQPGTNLVVIRTTGGLFGPAWRSVFGDEGRRSTMLHELFYLVEQQPGRWVGAGLFVAGDNPQSTAQGLGTLWRYEDMNPVSARGARAGEQVALLNNRFLNNTTYRTNYVSRLMDGVVFFRVTPFGPQGQPLDDQLLREVQNANANSPFPFPIPAGVVIGPNNAPPAFPINGTFFKNRSLPNALEIELGILPTQLVDQYRVLDDVPAVRNRFLTNNAANVLVFRQRIPLPAAPVLLP